MAIGCTSPIFTDGSDTDATSYTTASITPVANRLYLLAVLNSRSGAAATVPTATGAGLTWVQVDTQEFASGSPHQRRITVFRAMGSGSAGALTVDFGGVTQSGFQAQVAEFTGVDTSGTNGSGAIVQAVKDLSTSGTSISKAMAAFGASGNRGYAAVGHDKNESKTPRASWTELRDPAGSYGSPTQNLETQWSDAAGADNTVSASWATSANAAIIGIEVAEAGFVSSFVPRVIVF